VPDGAADTDRPGAAGGRLYVYAVLPSGSWDLGTGIDSAPLRLVATGGVAAVVHDHGDRPPISGSDAEAERRVLEHGAVVERCWEQAGTVLPMTVNVLVAAGDDGSAEDRLAAWLAGDAHGLSARLDALRGRVELRIDVSLDSRMLGERDDEVQAARREQQDRPPGVQRLLQKRIEMLERELADRLADDLHPQLRRRIASHSETVAANRRAPRESGLVSVLSLAALVRREDVEKVGAELSAILAEEPAIRVRFLGPWPPYSFAETGSAEAALGA
jgi:Gas vesicle synthesis protein GvpL/GvpF